MSWQHWTLLAIELLASLVVIARAVNLSRGGDVAVQVIGFTLFTALLVWGQNG